MPPKASSAAQHTNDPKKRKPSLVVGNSRPQGGQNSHSERGGGRDAKRVKVYDARQIDTQPASTALKDGELDLQAFLKSREFEIRALEDGMRRSKEVNASRAFQKVPRDMRRRTASHNTKRLPKRLRPRATREQATDNTPHVEARKRRPRTTKARIRAETAKKLGILAKRKANRESKSAAEKAKADAASGKMEVDRQQVGILARPPRPKIRPNMLSEKPTPKSKFRKRQKDKIWLPTHIWHAKRAKMSTPENGWGFAIPITPTAKSYRATHRAVEQRGAICWDTSYMSTLRMRGDATQVEALFASGSSVSHTKWKAGSRFLRAPYIHRKSPGVYDAAGVLEIMWNPVVSQQEPASKTGPEGGAPEKREVFVRTHPAVFRDVWNSYRTIIRAKKYDITLEDLRYEIGSITLAGPASTEALLGTLHPYYAKSDQEEPHAEHFKNLGLDTSPSLLPANVVMSFSVQDPRLHYPPRTFKEPDLHDELFNMQRLQNLASWPADQAVKPSALFDANARYRASCLPTQGALDRRRAAQPPGTETQVITAADPPIPITLLASQGNLKGSWKGSWTVLAPMKCILPLWRSLMRYPVASGGNPRFGGLNELMQVTFEQGALHFPRDQPSSPTGLEWEMMMRRERAAGWASRPPGRRVAFESLDLGAGRQGEVGSPHACAWETLFGWEEVGGTHRLAKAAANAATQQQQSHSPDDHHGSEGDTAVSTVSPVTTNPRLHPTDHPLQHTFTTMTKSAFNILVRSPSAPIEPQVRSAIVSVSVTMVGRGVPAVCARIYRLPTRSKTSSQAQVPATIPHGSSTSSDSLPADLRKQWLSLVSTQRLNAHHNGKPGKGMSNNTQPRRIPEGADLGTRKRLLADTLLSTKLPYPPPKTHHADMDGHPLVPNAEDLIGFVTTGGFNLSLGKGFGIGHMASLKTAESIWTLGLDKSDSLEGRLCIVRNVGESVGWLARWELVET